MKITEIKCPNCGADIKIRNEGKNTCPYCGTNIFAEQKKDNVIINTVINNYGDIRQTQGEQKAKTISTIMKIVVYSMMGTAAVFVAIFLAFWGYRNKGEILPVEKVYVYRTSVESEFMKAFCTEVFKKPVEQIGKEDYDRIYSLRFVKENDNVGMAYTIDEDTNERIYMAENIGTNSDDIIELEDLQCFENLKSINFRADGYSVRIKSYYGENETLKPNLRNLEKLTEFLAPSYTTPSDLENFFCASEQIRVLSVAVNSVEDVKQICSEFSNLEELTITYVMENRDTGIYPDLSELSSLKMLSSFSVPGQVDLSFLPSMEELTHLTVYCGSATKDFSVLYGLNKLKKLELYDAKNLKTIDFVKNMPELESFALYGSKVISLEALRDHMLLTSLKLSDNDELVDGTPIESLTSLRELQLGKYENYSFNSLNGLTNLETVSLSAKLLDYISGMEMIKKLTILSGGNDIDLTVAGTLTGLESLEVCGDDPVLNPSVLSACPALKNVYFDCELYRIDNADVFNIPSVECLKFGDKPLRFKIDLSRVEDNDHLKVLVLPKNGENVNLSDGKGDFDVSHDYCFGEITQMFSHFSALEELTVRNAKITDLSFVSSMPNLVRLDIGGNYVSDLSPLADLTHLEYLNGTGNPIANEGALPDSVIVVK